jgi:hypothetical protein
MDSVYSAFNSLHGSAQELLGAHASAREDKAKAFLRLKVEGLQNVSDQEVSDLARHLSQQIIPAGTEIDVRFQLLLASLKCCCQSTSVWHSLAGS